MSEYEETMNNTMEAYKESTGSYPVGQDLTTVENIVIAEVEKDAS